jgi:hypothetical protein
MSVAKGLREQRGWGAQQARDRGIAMILRLNAAVNFRYNRSRECLYTEHQFSPELAAEEGPLTQTLNAKTLNPRLSGLVQSLRAIFLSSEEEVLRYKERNVTKVPDPFLQSCRFARSEVQTRSSSRRFC